MPEFKESKGFKMKGYSPYTGSSFKMKKYNSPAYQKQEDWEPAYPGADYSKEELEIMSADERATAEGQAKLKEMREYRKGEAMDKLFKGKEPMKHVKRPKTKSPGKQTDRDKRIKELKLSRARLKRSKSTEEKYGGGRVVDVYDRKTGGTKTLVAPPKGGLHRGEYGQARKVVRLERTGSGGTKVVTARVSKKRKKR